MAVGKDIFPKGCWMGFLSTGQVSAVGGRFIDTQTRNDREGKGVEHPCYWCRKDDCDVREVEYRDKSGRYITRPESPTHTL